MSTTVRLTEYSHGAGCGCKIAPDTLSEILHSELPVIEDPALLVGNSSRDDAAVYEISPGLAVISTTDFFMPIVDDPFDFGRIAATNAISDIYAMGGKPAMAIAILGWPLDKLPAEVAAKVVDGGRQACHDAGILLAGGHSIDAPEPIFGLAVTGMVKTENLKRNDRARAHSRLLLSKPLGVGILTTAEKRKILAPEHQFIARDSMCQLNLIGEKLSNNPAVSAMTDITGFGLLGHLLEICEGSGVDAEIAFNQVPRFPAVDDYLQQGCSPGGTTRNFAAYGEFIGAISTHQAGILCDPQTSGGLLIAIDPQAADEAIQMARAEGFELYDIGQLIPTQQSAQRIQVN